MASQQGTQSALTVAVFGAAGQLGSALCQALADSHHTLLAYDRQSADFTNLKQIDAVLRANRPDVVINACAYTAVDLAEDEQPLADLINHLAVEHLARVCADIDAVLFHVSTDYVFDGLADTPYTETSEVNPSGVYGATKLAGEQAIAAACDQHVILRTSWVFGEHGKNFVKTMVALAENRDSLNVVGDQHGKPTYTGDIVAVLLELLAAYQRDGSLPWGIYHCSDDGACSWYEFACAIFDQSKKQGLLARVPQVTAIPTSGYPTKAKRPAYSVMDCRKLEQLLGRPMPHWRFGLALMLQSMASEITAT